MSSKQIFALRKQKLLAEALEMARVEYPNNATDVWFLRAYAWSLYDHVKNTIDSYEEKKISPVALNINLTSYMREFAAIADPLRKDSAFSQMLRLTGKVAKEWDEFLGFARWAGVDDFSDEDKAQFINDQGKTVDSLQKRFTRAICREVATRAADAQTNNQLIDWAKNILKQALKVEPNDQWLNYYQSKLYLVQGQATLAIKSLVPVVRRQSRAAWSWAKLGEILEGTRSDDALNCYTYATFLAREEQEIAKVGIHLAQRLSIAGRFDEAAQQASLALKYREDNSFKVPQELSQLLASDWYQQAIDNNNLQPLPNVEVQVKNLLKELEQHSLTYIRGVIDHINSVKALSYVATSATAGFGLSHHKFPQVANLVPGTLVEVGCATSEGPPLDWKLSDAHMLTDLCEILSGHLERQEGKDFAFIRTNRADIFVAPALAHTFATQKKYNVTCIAIRLTNKEGKTGWRAVKFIEK